MTESLSLRYGPGVIGWRTKVQGKAALWGSLIKQLNGKVTPPDAAATEAPHVVLFIRVDLRGNPVRIYRSLPANNGTERSAVITLGPSEAFGIRIDGTICVDAVVCDENGNEIGGDAQDSFVDCVLMPAYW